LTSANARCFIDRRAAARASAFSERRLYFTTSVIWNIRLKIHPSQFRIETQKPAAENPARVQNKLSR
jgi:hypothetical protein